MTFLACTWPVPALVNGAPSCHLRYCRELASYRQVTLWAATEMVVAGAAPASGVLACAGATSFMRAAGLAVAVLLVYWCWTDEWLSGSCLVRVIYTGALEL